MTTDESMMLLALDEAGRALDLGELPVGAVVARDTEIVARAHNERETSGDPTAHAEVLALREAAHALGRWRLFDCTLYVTLEPCAMCAGAAVAARVGRVVWGAPDERAGCAGSVYRLTEDPAFTHYAKSDGMVMQRECRALLDQFFASARGRTRA